MTVSIIIVYSIISTTNLTQHYIDISVLLIYKGTTNSYQAQKLSAIIIHKAVLSIKG